ncbi:MAG: hypothetical protein JST79_17205 [Acidobacteria bacterium]|nr:hypothetical protein [Acidobacteriota bacterium]
MPSRRSFLDQLFRIGASIPLAAQLSFAQASAKSAPRSGPFSDADDQFLNDMEKANFLYFWEQANPKTGLVKDRCNVRQADNGVVGSIAATGFGLTALCIGANRGFAPSPQIQERVLNTLQFLWKKTPNHRGFFYHWIDINSGERVWDAEVSSVDTAILLCGVLTAREYFRNSEIRKLASAIFDRVEWTWLSEDTPLLPHGWSPEIGFLPYRWDYYSELMMMYLLGMGSASHPLKSDTWMAWKRQKFEYHGLRYIGSFAPLFVHQYSQAWFDFRKKRDKFTDYFENSVIATEVHRRFCLELAKEFPSYSEDLWGITASDSPSGYVVWGGPPAVGPIDGSIVPSAAGGSLPFLPDPVMRVLRTLHTRYPQSWSRYGFVNAMNPLTHWFDSDVIGIDTGITMLMAENARSNFVWKTFMQSAEARRGMERAGFEPY